MEYDDNGNNMQPSIPNGAPTQPNPQGDQQPQQGAQGANPQQRVQSSAPQQGANPQQRVQNTAPQQRVRQNVVNTGPMPAPTPPPYAARPYPAPEPRRGGAWKGIVGGAIAGAVVSAGLVGILLATGVLRTKAPLPTSGSSTSGQTINIATAGEDATVAEAVAAKCLPSVVAIYVNGNEGEAGIGSGVILDNDGNIITNWHVAGEASSISVTIDGQSYDATVVGGDASSDIAVIRADLNGAKVTPMEVGDSSALVVGDWVMTLGSPLGLDQSASTGIVSALYRNQLMQSTTGNTIYTNLIQVDAAINGGNSGGALVNEKGQLVGINTLYANAAGMESFSGIGFAIPGNYAVDIANKVIRGEKVTHAYIGVSCNTVNAQNAQANHLSVNQGAYIAQVADSSPAAQAGLKKGDIVTKIGEHDVTSADGLILAVRSYAVGDQVEVKFVRDGKEQSVQVTLGSDESLQAEQEKQRKEEEEQYQRQLQEYEQYLNQQQNNQNNRQQNNQQSPWDSYSFPWDMWNWDNNTQGNPGMYSN